jgi:hypothetical protein
MIVKVPGNLLTTKEYLFSWFNENLRFPYFGWNWDSFDELLADLWWIKEPQLVLQHTYLPLSASAADLQIYKSILEDAVRTRERQGGEPQLLVLF